MSPLRAALYARVSTLDKGQAPEMQLRELREYCERRGWTWEIFVDEGISGAKEKRPELDRLFKTVRARKCDVVLVYRFDRFARSLKQLILALEEFSALGVQFVSVHESVDTTTPAGRMLFQVIGAMAEFERSITVQRVRSGMEHARAMGITIGRPRVQVDTMKILALRRRGASWAAIGRKLGISRNSAQRLHVSATNAQKGPILAMIHSDKIQ